MDQINSLPGRQMASGKEGATSMNNVIKTSFVGRNPFKPVAQIDVSTIKVTNDKPKKRKPVSFKYEGLFSQLDIGKSLSCLPQDCDKVGQALRDYIRRNELNWTVKVQSNYTKTTGRVFVLEKS
jgi:hypothetical protein